MKKIIISSVIIIITLFTNKAFTQSNFSYQAVLRNNDNQLVQEKEIGIQISILKGDISGQAVFVESHQTTTDLNGLFSIKIGNGTHISGAEVLDSIEWNNDTYFIKSEIDPNGSNNYQLEITSELLTVPTSIYSAYSNKAEVSEKATMADTAKYAKVAEYALSAPSSGNNTTITNKFVGYYTSEDGFTQISIQAISNEQIIILAAGSGLSIMYTAKVNGDKFTIPETKFLNWDESYSVTEGTGILTRNKLVLQLNDTSYYEDETTTSSSSSNYFKVEL